MLLELGLEGSRVVRDGKGFCLVDLEFPKCRLFSIASLDDKTIATLKGADVGNPKTIAEQTVFDIGDFHTDPSEGRGLGVSRVEIGSILANIVPGRPEPMRLQRRVTVSFCSPGEEIRKPAVVEMNVSYPSRQYHWSAVRATDGYGATNGALFPSEIRTQAVGIVNGRSVDGDRKQILRAMMKEGQDGLLLYARLITLDDWTLDLNLLADKV